jgi:Cd2+/Zn2+-exporting ATPase
LAQAGPDVPPDRDALLAIAAAVERHSEHPLARAIVRHAEKVGVTAPPATAFRALPGAGAEASVSGRQIHLGNPTFFERQLGIPLDTMREEIVRLQSAGKTVIVIGADKSAWGLIALRDNLRANARRALDGLHAAGVRVVMLTGDNARTAQAIAQEAGIDEVFAELKPADKVAKIRELVLERGHVAMVGDGINDAPALAEASVGIAMGAAGTDVALETADVALMADDLEKLVYALNLAKRTQRVVRQNLALSAVVIGALIAGAVVGVFSLPIVVVAHELSEFIVIASGLRMLRS